MKIRPDQIEGVQPDQQVRKNKAKEPGQAFGDLLNQEVTKGSAPVVAGVAPPMIVNPMLAAGPVCPVSSDAEVTPAGQVESILDKWDAYAADLADPGAGLKSAYGTLDEISDEVAAIKETDLDPGLRTIVDEMETLAAAEKFKFNRGDYV